MSVATTERITAPELERLILEHEPAAVFVPRTILRRVVRQEARRSALEFRVPHAVCYTLSREDLLRVVERDEMGPAASAELPERVILLRRPEPDKLANQVRAQALLYHWRVLFYARVRLALENRAAAGKLSAEEAGRRWQQVGDPARREIATLLHLERGVPEDELVALWVEFVAFYLGLRTFSPERLGDYFPGVRDFSEVDRLVAADLDVDAVLAATRLPGAAEPCEEEAVPPRVETYDFASSFAGLEGRSAAAEARRTLGAADRSAGRGNDVRAAVRRVQAARSAEATARPAALIAALADVDHLVARLRDALPDSAAHLAVCRPVLAALVIPAAESFWPQEARLLYDLQKICIDHERPLYKVDLLGWIRSLGRLPVRRLVPGQREVLIVQHLRSAESRLRRVRLGEEDGQFLSDFFRDARHGAEARLRETFRPLITDALVEVGFRPRNLPEHAAQNKIIEELLDRIDAVGLLTVSDLRDALSRNDLKLEDLSGPTEFVRGDRMLQLDRKLGASMESVYRRGEFYLRGLQSLSSLAFGTPLGRLLTTWVALPFGGAYVALEGLQHLAHLLGKHVLHTEEHGHFGEGFLNPWSVGLVGLFLIGVLNSAGFRRRVGQGVRGCGRLLYWVLIAGPRALLTQPFLVRLYHSPPVLFARRLLIKPAICAGLVWLVHWYFESAREWRIVWSAAAFVVALIFFNTRVGRSLEEQVTDRMIDTWHHLGELFPALFRFVMWLFKALLQAVDRVLYTVDEWLRFRQGEGRWALAAKAVLGAFWFSVTYVIRFALNLLVEPQINPIKHFPVVTVAHKVMLPFIPTLAGVLSLTLDAPLAYTVATLVISSTPGLFGFLVWELKENYRLYAANRPPDLRPVVVGSHGETVLRFLRPGFHSGTVPRAFARLRRAIHRADPRKRAARAGKQRAVLHHVEEAVRHLVECDLLFFLTASGRWSGEALRVGHVALGLHSIQVELHEARSPTEAVWIEFEEAGGWLVATVRDQGYLGTLNADQRRVLRNGLIGLFKKAGVAVLTAQVQKCLGPRGGAIRVTETGLAVMTPAGGEAVYDLDGEERIAAQGNANLVKSLPTFAPREFLFRAVPVAWNDWVDVWESEQAGYAKELLSGLPVWEVSESGACAPSVGQSHG